VKRIATCTDQRSIVPETDALPFTNCDQAFFNSLLMFSFGQKRFTNLITARFFTPGLPLRYADYSRRLRLALSC
jgi:hypothetical protein